MREIRRTFHVGPRDATRPIVLRSTAPGYWRAPDDALFQHYGHAWLGPESRRYRIERWGASHTDRTFSSLQSAVNDWARAEQAHEKKSPQQLDAEIAESLTAVSTRHGMTRDEVRADIERLKAEIALLRSGQDTPGKRDRRQELITRLEDRRADLEDLNVAHSRRKPS